MTDYTKASGEGTLMIRDTGTVLEFWVKPYYSSFWWENLSFTLIGNGNTYNFTADFDGNAWKKVNSLTVTSSQTVTFKLNTATGTSSLGGPTTFSQYIDRADPPPAPDAVVISSLTDDTLRTSFSNNGNGGASLDGWQIARNTSNTVTGATIVNCGSDQIYDWSGLTPGATYYFWARVHNVKGYSGWSAVKSVKMLRKPFAPTSVAVTQITQTTANVAFGDPNNGGSAITSRSIAYNTSNTLTGATIISSDGDTTITNLLPGRQYYFWTRANNAYGSGDWSVAVGALLVAGAFVASGGVYKRAVPWINDGGTWKLLRPWQKSSGIWKQTK